MKDVPGGEGIDILFLEGLNIQRSKTYSQEQGHYKLKFQMITEVAQCLWSFIQENPKVKVFILCNNRVPVKS